MTDVNASRREFLLRFCQGAGATLIPKNLWGLGFNSFLTRATIPTSPDRPDFYVHPHYRSDRPLDATLLKTQAGSDEFITEKYADQLEETLRRWRQSLLGSPRNVEALASNLGTAFTGCSLQPMNSRTVRTAPPIEVRQHKFASGARLSRDAFLRSWQSSFGMFSKIDTAEFQITRIDLASAATPTRLITVIRYEIAGSGEGTSREQRVGHWELNWQSSENGGFQITTWRVLNESQARSASPIFADVTAASLGTNDSYSSQLLHGTDYWRTLIDGAAGIDVYGHNGVSVADIDNDGFDDLYVCQPAGLPNRLYRNRGDGTFEDITESSGLGLLENTVCALFADYNNDGLQDVILVRINGPLLFINEGKGKFREHPDAFRFS